jgi:hypothetical protein
MKKENKLKQISIGVAVILLLILAYNTISTTLAPNFLGSPNQGGTIDTTPNADNQGCTFERACNYDENATENDGSCEYYGVKPEYISQTEKRMRMMEDLINDLQARLEDPITEFPYNPGTNEPTDENTEPWLLEAYGSANELEGAGYTIEDCAGGPKEDYDAMNGITPPLPA